MKEGYTQEVDGFNNKERRKFGELLSKLFLSEWKTIESKSNNEDHEMVSFLLNWPAFSEYLKICEFLLFLFSPFYEEN